MNSHNAFFYGTLMAREVLHRVIYENDGLSDPVKAKLAAKLRIRPAILHDHTRRRVRYADYPGMIPLAGHTVRGTYVTGLRDIDIRRLDMFEGGQYERQKIRCHIITEDGKSTGEECVAETYTFTEGDEHLENREWDYEEFRRDKLYRWSGQSEEFKESDEFVDETLVGEECELESEEDADEEADKRNEFDHVGSGGVVSASEETKK